MTRIEDGAFLRINGEPQWVTIRGDDAANPAILIVGGPGGALSPLAPLYASWERDFTVVQWDQPGGGATFQKNGEPEDFTYARLAADGIAVARAARERLGGAPLALFAISGGTVTGLTMLRAAPDLFAAYVGNGQIVNWAAQEEESYRLVLERARAADDATAVAELEGVGPPPWADLAGDFVKSKYCNALTPKEQAAFGAVLPQIMSPPPGASWLAPGQQLADPRARGAVTFAAIKPELEGFDAAKLGLAWDLPMILLQGADDLYTVTAHAVAWHETITAPARARALIDGAGHGSSFLAEELRGLLSAHLRPLL